MSDLANEWRPDTEKCESGRTASAAGSPCRFSSAHN